MTHQAITDRSRIIELFAHPQALYRRADVLRLTRITDDALDRQLASGGVSWEVDENDTLGLPWEDVALLALNEWTPRMIAAALREHDITPPLNQHRLIRVSLPIYLIRLLDHRARAASAAHHVPRNASDIIEELLSFNADDHELHDAIPGFLAALRYPFTTPHTDSHTERCRYCDSAIAERSREVCPACTARHEPDEHRGEDGLPELDETE